MAIQYYDDGAIKRDTGFVGDGEYCVYADNGQGCRTVWFKSVAEARKALLSEEGLKHGGDLFDCTKCGCHYSAFDENFKKFPMHACTEAKLAYAKSFE